MSWTVFPLSRTSHAVQIYKCLQIIGILFNNTFRPILLSAGNLFVLSQHVIYTFVSIKFHDTLPILFIGTFISAIVLCFVYETVTFPLFGTVNTNSASFLARSGKSESKEVRKTRRGLMELGVSAGGCYLMKRYSLLTFMLLVCTTTGNLLVST